MTASIRAASAAERVIGPAWSRLQDRPITPCLGTRPKVGLSPVIPQYAAGIRIEPPVSVPIASGISRAATAAPDPEDEPPVVRVRSHGLRQGPKARLSGPPPAHQNQPRFATRRPPASASRAA